MKKRQKNFQFKIVEYKKDTFAPEKAAHILEKGGLIIFPTNGVYGIGADIHNITSVKKIYHIKKRALNKPLLILIKNIAEVEKYCINIPQIFFELMKTFWPGDITFIMDASDNVPQILTGNTGKIGVRIPAHPFLTELLNIFKNPITGTSANISGNHAADTFEELDPDLVKEVQFIIKSNKPGNKSPSTILEASKGEIKIIREGRVKEKDLKKFLI